MGKYTDKFRRLVESPISREAIMDEAVNVEYEIARLQCEKAELEKAIRETLEENKHLADGENCTLAKLKKVVGVK